jgi:D-alanine-D-alanine ligase-like ATP-grasp enzyme
VQTQRPDLPLQTSQNICDARKVRGRAEKDSFKEIIRERTFIRRDHPTFAKHENAVSSRGVVEATDNSASSEMN